MSSKVDEPRFEEEEEEKDHGGLLHNYCPTAGDNERRLAAELARDSLCALVPCKEMARGSGALGSCTEVARDSVVALWSAACRDTPRYAEIRRDTPRYAEPAARVRYYSYASKQYGVDVTKKEKWTSGYDSDILCLPPLFYI